MIKIKDKGNCCGCGACQQKCARKAITMKEDEEGFLYPIVDVDSCNNCGLCEKVCPIINVEKEHEFEQNAYLLQHNDQEILRQSTSGGAFTAIAQWVLKNGGVVFGAAWDSLSMSVKHVYVEDVDSLKQFRNSKYVQSVIGDCYFKAEEFLKQDRLVLFSGTPCQIEGLLRYLRGKRSNLILLDVVCRACPSPLVLRKYIKSQEKNTDSRVSVVFFREKVHGYKYSALTLYDQNRKRIYNEGIDTDKYLRAFFSDLSVRPSCYTCAFKKRYRVSDFTIWDCFDAYRFDSAMDNDKGATRVLAHTSLAKRIIEDIDMASVVPIPVEEAVSGVYEMLNSVAMNPSRTAFFEDVKTLPDEQIFEKWFPITIRHVVEKRFRLLSCKLGIYKTAKRVFKNITGNKKINR